MSREHRKAIIIIIAIVLIIAVGVGAFFLFRDQVAGRQGDASAITETTSSQFSDDDWTSTISYNGKTYKLNKNLETILFMGVDGGASVVSGSTIGNGGRCDTIILFVLDKENRTIKALEVSRNTMTDVDIYNDDRELIMTGPMQICMQYAYSDSPARGCYIMKNKVSDVLLGIHIGSHCSLTMDGIAVIVDDLGGISITMEEDCTDINPEYTEGAVVKMDGAAAERFVRYRDRKVTGSNENGRMTRQAWFIRQFFSQMKGISKSRLADAMDAAGSALETDMDAETLAGFLKYDMDPDILTAPGTVANNIYDEYYIDQEALKEMIVTLLYNEAD